MRIFNAGDYCRPWRRRCIGDDLKVLYPSDAVAAGQELRLMQEYFLVACAVRDIFRRYLRTTPTCAISPKVAIQLNDTHPALTVAELMRTLVDETASMG